MAGDYNNINYNFTAAPLGLDKKNLINRLSVYPNPVSDILKVTNFDNLSNASFRIVNVAGQMVQKSSSSNNEAIDMSNLKTGVYLISMDSQEGNK